MKQPACENAGCLIFNGKRCSGSAAFLANAGHVLPISAHRDAALAAYFGHVFAIATHGLASLAADGTALFWRKIVATTTILLSGALLARFGGVALCCGMLRRLSCLILSRRRRAFDFV
jgi:hypothetical protein